MGITQLLADEIREMFDQHSPPVDPWLIAKEEGIIVKPCNFQDIDGCLEFLPSANRFVIYYTLGPRDDGRTRFTIAHELGHFYIEEHRDAILRGRTHGSNTDFRSDKKIEMEADSFASDLLLPPKQVARRLRYTTLQEIGGIAREFKTSISSTARKVIEVTEDACTIIFVNDGRVRYAKHSDLMRKHKLTGINKGDPVPPDSQTAFFIRTGETDRAKASIWASKWYKHERAREYGSITPRTLGYGDRKVWEEVMGLGRFGYLVLLWLDTETEDA